MIFVLEVNLSIVYMFHFIGVQYIVEKDNFCSLIIVCLGLRSKTFFYIKVNLFVAFKLA